MVGTGAPLLIGNRSSSGLVLRLSPVPFKNPPGVVPPPPPAASLLMLWPCELTILPLITEKLSPLPPALRIVLLITKLQFPPFDASRENARPKLAILLAKVALRTKSEVCPLAAPRFAIPPPLLLAFS